MFNERRAGTWPDYATVQPITEPLRRGSCGLLSFGIELYGPGYPQWRHVVFASIDASIAWLAVRRSKWLVVALVAFLADQIWEHGVEPVAVLVMMAALAAGLERLVPILRGRGL